MPPKRRRKGGSTAAKSSSSETISSKPDATLLLDSLLKEKPTESFECDVPFFTALQDQTLSDDDCVRAQHWVKVLVFTQALLSLSSSSDNNNDGDVPSSSTTTSSSIIMAYRVAQLLSCSTKIDETPASARPWVGKAVVSATVVACQGLEHHAIISFLTLDRLLTLQGIMENDDNDDDGSWKEHWKPIYEQQVEDWIATQPPTPGINDTSVLDRELAVLQAMQVRQNSALQLQQLCGSAPFPLDVGRLAHKRWSSVVLVWLCQAHERLLCHVTDPNLMPHVCAMLTAMGTAGGSRPPTVTGMEPLVRHLVQPPPTTVSSKSKLVGRPDIRDLAVCVMKRWIGNCCNDSSSIDWSRTNTDNNKIINNGNQIWKALQALASAAATSVSQALYSEQQQWTERLETLAAVFVIQQYVMTPNMDPDLVRGALVRLQTVLESTDCVPVDDLNAKIKILHLDEPLPEPELGKKPAVAAASGRTKRAAKSESNSNSSSSTAKQQCSFAGMFPPVSTDSANLQEEKVALFLRAMLVKGTNVHEALISCLVQIVTQCYEWTVPPSDQLTGRKRKAQLAAVGRRKKRKKDVGEEFIEDSNNEAQPVQYRPMGESRALLAAEAIQCLEKCFKHTFSCYDVRSRFLSALNLDHIARIIYIGRDVTTFSSMVRSRSDNQMVESDTVEYTSYEKKLWDSYVNLCHCLGRGAEGAEHEKSGIVCDMRLATFEIIVRSERGMAMLSQASFPLWLCAPHRRLIASTFSSGAKNDSSGADKFLAEGFIAGIAEVLSRLESLHRRSSADGVPISFEENAPLSVSHARIFCAAVVRLPVKERDSLLTSLIGTVSNAITSDSIGPVVAVNGEASDFLARTVSLCTGLAILTTCSVALASRVVASVGSYQDSYLPKSIRRGEDGTLALTTHYLTMFDTCTDFKEPDLAYSSMDSRVSQDLQTVLKRAFSLGMSSGCVDRCYLAFASWAGLGRSDLWCKFESSVTEHSQLPDDLSEVVLQLRNELCWVYRLMQKVNRASPKSSLVRLIDQKDQASRSLSRKNLVTLVKKELKAMVVKAAALSDELIDKFVSPDSITEPEVPTGVFVLLEMIGAYISFAMAAHSVPQSDFLSYLRERVADNMSRKRGLDYSSGSDNYPSDADSACSVDYTSEAVDRLQDVCIVAGGVPTHPDWLDEGVRLLETVSGTEARAVALMALTTLEKIASTANRMSNMSFSKLLSGSQNAYESSRKELAKSVRSIAWLKGKAVGPDVHSSIANVDVTSIFGTLCGINNDVSQLMLSDGLADEFCEDPGSCFWMERSAQRVLGRFHDEEIPLDNHLRSSELRAVGEWEILLSSALTSCGHPKGLSGDEATVSRCVSTVRWRRVYRSALNGYLPSLSLYRFASDEKGRKMHPLKLVDTLLADFDHEVLLDASGLAGVGCEAVIPAVIRSVSQESCDSPLVKTILCDFVGNSMSLAGIRGFMVARAAVRACVGIQRAALSYESEVADILRSPLEVACLVLVANAESSKPGFSLTYLKAALRVEVDAVPILGALGVSDSADSFSEGEGSDMSSGFVSAVVGCIWPDSWVVAPGIRSMLTRIMCSLVGGKSEVSSDKRGHRELVKCVRLALDSSPERLRALVETFVASCHEVETASTPNLRESLSFLLGIIIEAYNEPLAQRCGVIVDTMVAFRSQWGALPREQRLPGLALLLLCASRCGELARVVSLLVGETSACPLGNLLRMVENLEFVAAFLQRLRRGSADVKDHVPEPERLTDVCSHAKQSGFLDQHWYTCYTCGLTGDKGCCSLCALVCHRGHEVEYSRYSSFFCDCGAEGGGTAEGKKFSCKALVPIDRAVAVEALARGRCSEYTDHEVIRTVPTSLKIMSPYDYAVIATSLFREVALDAVSVVVSRGRQDSWVSTVFGMLMGVFSIPTPSQDADLAAHVPCSVRSCDGLRKSLRRRNAVCCKVTTKSDDDAAMVSVGHFSPGSFSMKVSSDSSMESTKRSLLSASGSCRQVVAVNSRGCVIVAEPESMVVSGLFPILCPGNVSQPWTRPSYLNSCGHSLDFNVIGMQFCRFDGSKLLLWGIRECAAYLLNSNFSKCEKLAGFELGLNGSENDFVLRCLWMPGTSNFVLVLCLRSIMIFDLTESRSVSASFESKLGLEMAFRDVAVIELQSGNRLPSWKIFMLMHDGHLHAFHLNHDTEGGFTSLDLNFDPKQSMKLPLKGVSNEPDIPVPFSLTLGEGVHLAFLEQSGLLLYQSVAGDVIAFQCDEGGTISASFVLLPKGLHDIDEEVGGPYTHWTELGMVEKDSSHFFRSVCVGTSSGKEPTVICVDFNSMETHVHLMRIASTGRPSLSVEGVTAFTVPHFPEDSDGRTNEKAGLTEKLFLIAAVSNGAIYVFTEATRGSPTGVGESEEAVAPERCPTEAQYRFPLLVFEELFNVSESDDVEFSTPGSEVNHADLRQKLHRDSEAFVTSEDSKPFVIVARMKSGCKRWDSTLRKAIVAVRVLVGSSSLSSIPQYLCLGGRKYDILAGIKRWYCFYMSPQEISASIRCGYVGLGVGPAHEGSRGPAIDALECFARDRSAIDAWLPTCLRSLVPERPERLRNGQGGVAAEPKRLFRLSLKLLSRICKLLGPTDSFTLQGNDVWKKIVKATTLDGDSKVTADVNSILRAVEQDEDSRESFRDMCQVGACSEFLFICNERLKSASLSPANGAFETLWDSLHDPLKKCIRLVSQIARRRPLNFTQVVGVGNASPAIIASQFMASTFSKASSNIDIIPDYVELCLSEMAIAAGQNYEGNTGFGSFEGLRDLLLCPNSTAVQVCVISIAVFCEKNANLADLQIDCDLFATPMVEYFSCDACRLLPIRDVRYSVTEESRPYDLCQTCYLSAMSHARRRGASRNDPVVIGDVIVGEDIRLTCRDVERMQAVKIQLQDQHTDTSEPADPDGLPATDVVERHQLFDYFVDRLFNHVLLLLTEHGNVLSYCGALLTLPVAVIHYSGDRISKLDRSRRLMRDLMKWLSKALDDDRAPVVSLLLQSFTRLAVWDPRVGLCLIGAEKGIVDCPGDSGSIETPKCPQHSAPTCRRMFVRGFYEGRHFYGCSKDPKSRCNFFLWDDKATAPDADQEPQFDEQVARLIWDSLCSDDSEGMALQRKLSRYIAKCVSPPERTEGVAFNLSARTANELYADEYEDGVFCSRQRLGVLSPQEVVSSFWSVCDLPPFTAASEMDRKEIVAESAIALLALVGRHNSVATQTWPLLLCEIVLAFPEKSVLIHLAKRALLLLCDSRKGLYISIRAHHTFGFHRDRLLATFDLLLDDCLCVREKARLCGPNWKTSSPIIISTFKARDALGTVELISENVLTAGCVEDARRVLAELAAVAKKRPDQWRIFCGLNRVPACRTLVPFNAKASLLDIAPIVVVFGCACLLNGDSQIKALRLLDLALSTPVASSVKQLSQMMPLGQGSAMTGTEASGSSPERILNLSVEDLVSFVVHIGCGGITPETRTLACSIASQACFQDDRPRLFANLVDVVLAKTSEMGKCHVEVLAMLQTFVETMAPRRRNLDVATVATKIQLFWMKQMQAIRYDRSNQEYVFFETRTSTTSQKKRYELWPCRHCHSVNSRRDKDKSKTSEGVPRVPQNRPDGIDEAPWHPEQVAMYSRGRLEGWRDSAISDEFSTYSSLKYRISFSEVHLEVNDPRGRFVKTIKIYASPRPVSDVSVLKTPQFAPKWQECGVISLPKGASRASCKLDKPVVAANLRIEFADFFERPGSSKASDGSFVVHCPRCTRIVTNAHGVCGNCGEVAFQCRKCRHINYDRLDAFLCVECGYCASGGFVFELNAAIASNAVAILNDDDYDRSCQMFAVASRLYEDLRFTLKEQLSAVLKRSDRFAGFPDLRKAFSGSIVGQPEESSEEVSAAIEKLGKQGSVVKAVARRDSHSAPSGRSQSLLRLTREWRESNSVSEARRSTGDILINIGRDLANDEESAEMFGLLEVAGRGGDDPLARLLASVQSRRERRTVATSNVPEQRGEESKEDGGASRSKSKSQETKVALDKCDRLYSLMREAEREASRLDVRIKAWRRLETDSLSAATGSIGELDEDLQVEPSHCSLCASPIAMQLLSLWLKLLEMDPDNVEVSEDMIRILLSEDAPITYKGLQDTKRRAVKDIALLSKRGSNLVLKALKLRLQATESVACAEIVGSIVQAGGSSEFLDLAMETLQNATPTDVALFRS